MRRHGRYGKSSNGVVFLLIVVLLAVFSGYTATKYIVAPILYAEKQTEKTKSDVVKNGKSMESDEINILESEKKDSKKSDTDVVVGEQEVNDLSKKQTDAKESSTTEGTETSASTLFCLQFGSFSSKSAAETCVQELTQKNIPSFVMEKSGSFKVLSIPYDGEQKAKAVADELKPVLEDVYVVSM